MIRQIDFHGDELLTRGEVARLLGIAEHTLACWRCSQKGPPMVKFGSGRSAAVRYRRSAIEAWLADHDEAQAQAAKVKPSPKKATAKRSRSR